MLFMLIVSHKFYYMYNVLLYWYFLYYNSAFIEKCNLLTTLNIFSKDIKISFNII